MSTIRAGCADGLASTEDHEAGRGFSPAFPRPPSEETTGDTSREELKRTRARQCRGQAAARGLGWWIQP